MQTSHGALLRIAYLRPASLFRILIDRCKLFARGCAAGHGACAVAGLALIAALLAPSAAGAQVRITKVTGQMQGGQWVETVEIENTGNTNVTQWFVTSQAYDGAKWQYGEDPATHIPKSGET